jgi:hypothetical protein
MRYSERDELHVKPGLNESPLPKYTLIQKVGAVASIIFYILVVVAGVAWVVSNMAMMRLVLLSLSLIFFPIKAAISVGMRVVRHGVQDLAMATVFVARDARRFVTARMPRF